MTDHREHARRGWAKFLNPETLRDNLVAASIFLAAYEMLQASVIDRILSFFSKEFRDDKWITSEDYQTQCLALAKSPFQASLLWLKQMSVIDDDDIAQADSIRKHRNELAHDLPKFLSTADSEVNVELLGGICDLVAKIDRWWIREVDMATDPDFNGHYIVDQDITSGNMLFIQMMLRIAIGEDSEVYWEEFRKQSRAASEQDDNRHA